MRRGVPVVWVILLSFGLSSCEAGKRATVLRDEYGVPHIFSSSEEAAAYALGYVQAEDRIAQLMMGYRLAEGRLAEVFGRGFAEMDFEQRVWRHAEISRLRYPSLPKHLRLLLEAFAAGINDYQRQHRDRVPEWAIEAQPWHPLALGRAFIWGWPLDDAKGDLRRGLRREAEPQPPRGSNQWAVAPARSATGTAIALIDPHLGWEDEGHWYEARIHAGRWQACGMVVVGTPFIGLGHTTAVSWAATTGGPDCGDCYLETLDDGERPSKYRYDGAWRPLQVDTVVVLVREAGKIDTLRRTVLRTHHGPIYERRGTRGYSLALPYAESVGLVEQLYRMNRATSLAEFQEAMGLCEFMPQNIMVADVEGNIWYVRTGRVPIRPAGFDWSFPVPGDTSATEWKGIHAQSDLVQILNPDCGYMQNCNISPGTMMHSGAPKPQGYPAYIYNDREDRSNPRGRRAVEVLSRLGQMSREDAFALAFDTKVYGAEAWQRLLAEAFQAEKKSFGELEEAVNRITGWNGRLDKEQSGATLYYYWRLELGELGTALEKVLADSSRPDPQQNRQMLAALRRACQRMRRDFGREVVPWGDFLRLVRGNQEWPLSGGSFGYGISVLRAIWGKTDGQRVRAAGGQSCPMLVFLSKPIESYSILPWGVSDDPTSPHFADQAPLFADGKMKPTWFVPDSAQKHAESQVVLIFRKK